MLIRGGLGYHSAFAVPQKFRSWLILLPCFFIATLKSRRTVKVIDSPIDVVVQCNDSKS